MVWIKIFLRVWFGRMREEEGFFFFWEVYFLGKFLYFYRVGFEYLNMDRFRV